MKLSVIIPVYNERETVEEIVRAVLAVGRAYEIILVDDGSTDGTRDLYPAIEALDACIKVHLQAKNQGKGTAVRTGFALATGDIFLIQDADMEYDPRDYEALVRPIVEGKATVVYGSRFRGGPTKTMFFWHMVGNKFLTLVTNILYNTILSDMETGYKVFRKNVVEGMTIHAKRFDFEPEFTAKILKRKYRIFEVPIAFNPRDYSQGKKIKLKDAFEAVWTLLKYRFMD